MVVSIVHGQPFCLSHFRVSSCPFLAALSQVLWSQGQPLAFSHFTTSMWPPAAASEHICTFQGHPVSRNHANTSMWPPRAAAQATVIRSQGAPFEIDQRNASRVPYLLPSSRCIANGILSPATTSTIQLVLASAALADIRFQSASIISRPLQETHVTLCDYLTNGK